MFTRGESLHRSIHLFQTYDIIPAHKEMMEQQTEITQDISTQNIKADANQKHTMQSQTNKPSHLSRSQSRHSFYDDTQVYRRIFIWKISRDTSMLNEFQNFSVTPPREPSPPPKFTNRKNMLDDEIVAYIDRSLQSYKDTNAFRQQSERYNSSNDLNQNDFYFDHNRRGSNVDDYDRVWYL